MNVGIFTLNDVWDYTAPCSVFSYLPKRMHHSNSQYGDLCAFDIVNAVDFFEASSGLSKDSVSEMKTKFSFRVL